MKIDDIIARIQLGEISTAEMLTVLKEYENEPEIAIAIIETGNLSEEEKIRVLEMCDNHPNVLEALT